MMDVHVFFLPMDGPVFCRRASIVVTHKVLIIGVPYLIDCI